MIGGYKLTCVLVGFRGFTTFRYKHRNIQKCKKKTYGTSSVEKLFELLILDRINCRGYRRVTTLFNRNAR